MKKTWTNTECAKYFLCLEGEVFEFKCSVGLLFDVVRQICDFKANVDNCDVTSGECSLVVTIKIGDRCRGTTNKIDTQLLMFNSLLLAI